MNLIKDSYKLYRNRREHEPMTAKYKKFASVGIEKREKHLGIMLTETEFQRIKQLAQEAGLSSSAYAGQLVLDHLAGKGLLPDGYTDHFGNGKPESESG